MYDVLEESGDQRGSSWSLQPPSTIEECIRNDGEGVS